MAKSKTQSRRTTGPAQRKKPTVRKGKKSAAKKIKKPKKGKKLKKTRQLQRAKKASKAQKGRTATQTRKKTTAKKRAPKTSGKKQAAAKKITPVPLATGASRTRDKPDSLERPRRILPEAQAPIPSRLPSLEVHPTEPNPTSPTDRPIADRGPLSELLERLGFDDEGEEES